MIPGTGSSSPTRPWGIVAMAFILVSMLSWAPTARADDRVEYYASVDRDRVAIDDTLRLQVTLALSQKASPKDLQLPESPDFEVVSQGKSEQSSFSLGGGGPTFRRVQTWTLLLRPLKEGKLVILPGSVSVDGKRYETGRLTVEVTPPSGGGAQAQRSPGARPRIGMPDPDDTIGSLLGGGPAASERDLFVRATVDKTEAWVGEPITFSIYLLSRVPVSHVEGVRLPDLDGFWSESVETPRQISSSVQVVDGVEYRAYLIQRRALFPLRAGSLEIKPVELDVISGRSVFGGGRRHTRNSPTSRIEVKELPAGAPAGFSRGNVGEWVLEGEATPTGVQLGQPVTWKITVRGAGNVRNLELPAAADVEGFKIFEPTRTEQTDVRGGIFGGSKTAEYVLVPEKPGTFVLPSVEFSSFDPKTGKYLTQRTEPVSLTVLQGSGQAVAQAPGAPSAVAAPQVPASGLRQAPLAPVVAAANEPIYEKPWFFLALALPLLTWAGSVLAPKIRESLPKRPRARVQPIPGLADLEGLASRGHEAFFPTCERVLLDAAGRRLGRELGGMPRDEIVTALLEGGAAAEAVDAFRRSFEACDRARWAAGATGDAPADVLALVRGAVQGLGGTP